MSTIKKILSDSSTTSLSNSNTTDSDNTVSSDQKEILKNKIIKLLEKIEEKKKIISEDCFISVLNNKEKFNLKMSNKSDISDSSDSEISSIDNVSFLS